MAIPTNEETAKMLETLFVESLKPIANGVTAWSWNRKTGNSPWVIFENLVNALSMSGAVILNPSTGVSWVLRTADGRNLIHGVDVCLLEQEQ